MSDERKPWWGSNRRGWMGTRSQFDFGDEDGKHGHCTHCGEGRFCRHGKCDVCSHCATCSVQEVAGGGSVEAMVDTDLRATPPAALIESKEIKGKPHDPQKYPHDRHSRIQCPGCWVDDATNSAEAQDEVIGTPAAQPALGVCDSDGPLGAKPHVKAERCVNWRPL